MNHNEYIHIVPGADTAVLFIHGIIGTPDHFDYFIPLLPTNTSVYNILLDGHGKTPRDFSKTSMKRWESQVDQVIFELLSTHKDLYIVAHSMGTLFAIAQACKEDRIRGLFLLAVPIKPRPSARMFSNALKVYLGIIRPDDRFGVAAKAACSIKTSKNPLHYLGWVQRYFELFHKVAQTKKLLPTLTTPTVMIQSRLDEMVARNADRYLLTHAKCEVITLEKSYHYLYDNNDLSIIRTLFLKYISKINGGKP